jgi:predicted dehydrogenase
MTNLMHDHAWWFSEHVMQTPGVELVGVAEERDYLLDRMRRKAPNARYYHDAITMLDELKPDGLIILAQNNCHRALVEEAAQRGIHCVMDQPMATSYADALAMQEVADRSGIKLMVNCYELWRPEVADLCRRAKSGDIGDIYEITATRGMKGPRMGLGVLSPEYVGWMYDPIQHGPGVLYDQAGYGILYCLWLLGVPDTVSARRISLVKHPEGWEDDIVYLILGYPRATGVATGSWAWPHPRGEVMCWGSQGSLITRFSEPLVRKNAPETVHIKQETETVVLPETPPERTNGMAHFAHCLRYNLPIDPPQSAAMSLQVMKVMEAAKRSIAEGRTVAMTELAS